MAIVVKRAKTINKIDATGKREEPWVEAVLSVPMSQDVEEPEEEKESEEFKARGNMAGLAKHLAHQIGGDPHFFDKCMKFEKLQGYDEDVRAAVCAQAHKRVTGIWPGAHGGANPDANEPPKEKKQVEVLFDTSVMTALKEEAVGTIVIDNAEDDDWMKSLPGYAQEVEIHRKLAEMYAKKKDAPETKEVIKKVIATRGDGLFLVDIGDGRGVVVNTESKEVSESMKIDAFLKFGYWEEFSVQDKDILDLVK